MLMTLRRREENEVARSLLERISAREIPLSL
jgi:hypothetical protein